MLNLEIYQNLLTNFVKNNINIFKNAKKYEKSITPNSEVYCYIPENKEKEDPDFLGNTKVYKDFFNKFKEDYLINTDIEFDLKGHFEIKKGTKLGEYLKLTENYDVINFNRMLDLKITIDLFKEYLYLSGKEQGRFFTLMWKNEIEYSSAITCEKCSEMFSSVINFETKKVEPMTDKVKECKFSEKTPSNVKVKIKAPSKKLVFLNDPRKFLKIERKDKYESSINSLLGAIKETEFYEAHNVGFFFVGNTGLHAFKRNNEILISNYDEDSEKDEKKYKEYMNCGYVCMDLWWYTILDFDLFNKLCEENKTDKESFDYVVIDIDGTELSITHSLKAHKEGYHYGVHSKIKIK